MNAAQASRVVVVCAFIEGAFILARAKRGGTSRDTTVKSLWAIGVVTLGLSMVADFAPQIAGPFAVLMLTALAARSRGELGAVLGVGGNVPVAAPPVSAAGGAASGTESPGLTRGG